MVSTLLLMGDSRIISRQIPENSINTIVTSPPYLWQRDYGHADQIGHEITPDEYVQTLVDVFASLKPALRDDGSLWLNLGSTYASKRCGNFKPKDLIPTPWMTALALQNAGWYLRQDLIWYKTNPLRESMKDRFVRSHEYVLLLTKQPTYYFDIDSIREPHITIRNVRDKSKEKHNDAVLTPIGPGSREWNHPLGRTPSSVLHPKSTRFPGAHCAVYPPELIEPMIKAGCPEGGVVFDPFGGAGTTALVANQLGRNAVLVEISPKYVDLSWRRLIKHGLTDVEVVDASGLRLSDVAIAHQAVLVEPPRPA